MSASSPQDGKGAISLPAIVEPPSDQHPPVPLTWIIFGATGHIGRSLVRAALMHGDRITVVGKTGESSLESMQGWHPNCYGLVCDVRMKHTVDQVIAESVAYWGQVDVVVNCTGYGVIGAAEDQTSFDVENQFATNFMGTLHILQASIPYYRQNNIPGRFLIFSSTAGALGVPGLAPFCATKYAVEGLIESMLYEVNAFNIRATLVEPGYVRDDDSLGQDQTVKRYGHFSVKPQVSQPYDQPNSPAGHAKRIFQWMGNTQPTSAVRTAELCWQLAHCSYPPLRLLLGSYAVDSIRDRMKSIIEEIEDWKHLRFAQPEGEELSDHEDFSILDRRDESEEDDGGQAEEEENGD